MEAKVVSMEKTATDQPGVYADAKAILRAEAQKLWTMLEVYELPPEKMQAIGDYAIGMRAKNWHIKDQRIIRKTVEYFKLRKLTAEEYEALLKTVVAGSDTE